MRLCANGLQQERDQIGVVLIEGDLQQSKQMLDAVKPIAQQHMQSFSQANGEWGKWQAC